MATTTRTLHGIVSEINKEDILKRCKYAVPTDIKEAVIKELYS